MSRTYFNTKGSTDILVRTAHRTKPLPHQVYHSPTGMTWGYLGSGPHDTARSILYDYLRYEQKMGEGKVMHYIDHHEHEFCNDFVSVLQDGWKIESGAIDKWFAMHLPE